MGHSIGEAIAAFERSLVAMNSPFDRFRAGDVDALTAQQRRGLETFEEVGCDRCHDGVMFSDFDHHAEGVREHPLLAQPDAGAGRFRFRTPSLRNVALTAPYMHNGMLPTLRDVLRFYDNGRSENPNVSNARDRDAETTTDDDNGIARVSGQFRRVDNMSDGEMEDIIAFLNALTDASFDRTVPARVPSGLPPGGLDPLTARRAYRHRDAHRRRRRAALADLLPPHRVVQPLALEQLVVASRLDDPALLEDEDPVGMEHRGQPVRNHQRDDVASWRRPSGSSRVMPSSVSESSDEVASSKTSSSGRRSNARAIDSRCFSPPETLTPPSPMTVSSPLSRARQQAVARRLVQHLEAVGVRWRRDSRTAGFRGSFPENSCVSCVTNPMRSRSRSRSTSVLG